MRKSALLTSLLLGGAPAARGFLEALPEWSARLRADGRLAPPLAACVPIAIASSGCGGAMGGAARRPMARSGLSLALAAWLGSVAAAALVVGAMPRLVGRAGAPLPRRARVHDRARAGADGGELRLALVVAGAVVAVAVVLDAEGLPLGDGGDAPLRGGAASCTTATMPASIWRWCCRLPDGRRGGARRPRRARRRTGRSSSSSGWR